MKRVKTRTDSGAVCEIRIYNVADNCDIRPPKPRIRFRDEAEREAHRVGISRRRHARLFNANFGPTSYYGTLTFDNEYEVHTFSEARQVRDNYIKRLRYHAPNARIMIYMGRGKSTSRIHFHIVADGIPRDLLIKLWGMGEVVRVEPLREHNYYDGVDHGQDYTGLANYLFDHWSPEQGGKRRWKQTANLRQPTASKPVELKREYNEHKPPRTPKGYILVETAKTPYGYYYYKYVKQPGPHKRRKSAAR